jgi:hypothetical protein
MKKLSTGPLDSMLDQYDDAREQYENARIALENKKYQLCQLAIDQNWLDCLTVNVNRMRRYTD